MRTNYKQKLFPNLVLFATMVLVLGFFTPASLAADREQIKAEALSQFVDILDLWRNNSFEAVYDHLVPTAGSSKKHFVDQLNHSGRRPACCWEKIQDAEAVYLDEAAVLITARLGVEVEGVGTRFVTRSFRLIKKKGLWKLPEIDIINLAEPNMQRIPQEILTTVP